MTLTAFLKDTQKALGCLATVETTAVGLGLLDNAEAGYVTAGLGAVASVVVYLLDGPAKTVPDGKHEA